MVNSPIDSQATGRRLKHLGIPIIAVNNTLVYHILVLKNKSSHEAALKVLIRIYY